jgi:hypothetical protein
MTLVRMLFADLREIMDAIIHRVVFRLAGLVFLALAAALPLAIAGNINKTIIPFFFNVTAALCEGLFLGGCARLLLSQRTFALRLTATLLSLLAGLFYMGWLSVGYTGISPLPFPRNQLDRLALVLIASGTLGAFLALLAFRNRPEKTQLRTLPPEPSLRVDAVLPEPAPRAVAPAIAVRRPASRWPVNLHLRTPMRWLQDRGRDIRLLGTEDHRCPYCLQPVSRRDPRGIVVCPDCHTWHHKDCWSVTGMCQIPHEHAL